jgi:hypothetical protein
MHSIRNQRSLNIKGSSGWVMPSVMFQIKIGEHLPHHELREEHVPRRGASWSKIMPFAGTFNAYEQLQGFEPAAFAANQKARNLLACTLTDRRAALFFEYRRYNHFGYEPDAPAMVHLHALVEEIRRRIQNGEHLRGET